MSDVQDEGMELSPQILDFRTVIIDVTLTGFRPMLMHSARLSDPLDELVLKKKQITDAAKGGRGGEEKERKLAALEFQGGLWLDEELRPAVPGEAIESMLSSAASEWRLGAAFGRLVRCESDIRYPLRYEGQEKAPSLKELVAHQPEFSIRHRVKNSGMNAGSTWRTRPIFRKWSLDFALCVYLGSKVDLDHVKRALVAGGLMYGLGDWHGRFGLFHVTKFSERK